MLPPLALCHAFLKIRPAGPAAFGTFNSRTHTASLTGTGGHPLETMNTDDLLAAYKNGRRDFRGTHIMPTATPVTGACLDGADFSEARLTGVFLDHSELNRTSFRDAHISGASFSCSNLVGADLTGAVAQAVDMWQADLTRACLDGADFGPDCTGIPDPPADDVEPPCSSFRQAKLVRASAIGTEFDHAHLDAADLTHMDATGAFFRGAEMRNVNLIGTCIHRADFRDAHLVGAVKVGLAGTQLTDFLDPEDLPEKDREPSIHPDL